MTPSRPHSPPAECTLVERVSRARPSTSARSAPHRSGDRAGSSRDQCGQPDQVCGDQQTPRCERQGLTRRPGRRRCRRRVDDGKRARPARVLPPPPSRRPRWPSQRHSPRIAPGLHLTGAGALTGHRLPADHQVAGGQHVGGDPAGERVEHGCGPRPRVVPHAVGRQHRDRPRIGVDERGRRCPARRVAHRGHLARRRPTPGRAARRPGPGSTPWRPPRRAPGAAA